MSAKMRDLMALTFFLDNKKKSGATVQHDMERFKHIMEQPSPKQKGVTQDITLPKSKGLL